MQVGLHQLLSNYSPMKLNPYLNFNGKCVEAMTFYQRCLGGELMIHKVGESPMAAQMPSEAGAQVLHSILTGEDFIVMGSDMMGANLVNGNSISLLLQCTSVEQAEMIFSKLSEGGKVKTTLHQSFWGATYGELIDRFGLYWQLNFSKN